MKWIVKADRLYLNPADPAHLIEVGSAAWFDWLAQADQFIYQGETDRFSARRETRRGGYYWYGYRKRAGKLRKIYLGRAIDLTPDKLFLANITGFGDKGAGETPPPDLDRLLTTTARPADRGAIAPPFALSARLFPPALPPNLIDRPRLTRQINTPIVLITAPPGFGKTTLLNQWRQQCPGPVAWVSLEAGEDKVYSFWLAVVSAWQQLEPAPGEIAASQLASLTPPLIQAILTGLLQNLSQRPAGLPLAFIIDNYHRVNSPEIEATCQFFLDYLPPGVQVIIASQEPLPLTIPRWRGQGRVTELGRDELRLTPAEGVAWLGRILAVPLTDREKLALVMRVEGWCAGLNLLALALKKQDDVHRFVATFEGQHPYFQEYFVEEILKNYPAEWQHFLLQTSILKQLTASLGDAVTGQGGSELLLAQLCQANHFVALVDKMQGWYQYYPLFAQALQSQLAQQFPGQLTALHRRAAGWYQAHEFYSEAVHHLLQAGAWSEVAGLINRVILDELRRGIDHRLLKWLPQLPDELFIQHETLLFTYARLAMPSLPHQQVDDLLTRLSARLEAQPEAARTPIEQRLSVQLADWRQTGLIPAPPPPVDSADEVGHLDVMLDLMYQAFYRQQQGQVAASEAALWQALALGKASGMVFIIMVAGGRLAMRLAEQGRLRQSETLARDILQGVLAQTNPLPVSASVALTALGRICYARNQMAQARHWLDEAVRLDPHPTSANTVIHHHGLLAHILQQQGHQAEAMGAMQAALELGPTGEFPLAALKAHQAWLYLRAGESSTAEQILRQVSDYPLPPAYTRNGLVVTAWAELLLAQQRYPEAELLLALPADDFSPDPILLLSPYPTLLLAIAYWGQQQINLAVQTLLRAIFMAEPEGIIRPFLDGGPALIPLLTLSRRGGNLSRAQGHFVDQLLARLRALYPDAPLVPPEVIPISLSPREQEILRLLNEGLDNKALAARLLVSDSTVRTHLRNIYHKLGVNSRIQAVKRAGEMKLL